MKTRSLENSGKKENRVSRKRPFLIYGLMALFIVTAAAVVVITAPGVTDNSSAAVYTWNGDGTENNPFQICSVQDLANLADDVNTYDNPHTGEWFALMGDIDLSDYSSGYGWVPIGNDYYAFEGNFNGNGNTISNMFINDLYDNGVGLFGNTAGGIYENLNITDAKVTGYFYVGGVIGIADKCQVENCNVSGDFAGNSGSVGGLIGTFTDVSSVKNCNVIGNVSCVQFNVGGVIGSNIGTVDSCTFTGTVKGSVNVGGLIGYNAEGAVGNCWATGAVECTLSACGGLAGFNNGTFENCYNSCTVSGVDSVGGLAGYNPGIFNNCYNVGAVTQSDYGGDVGGLAGYNGGTIENCYNTGAVTLTGSVTYVGGVAGESNWGGTIKNCYNTGAITIIGSADYVCGVVGFNDYNNTGSTVENCFFLHEGTINDGLSGYYDCIKDEYLNDGAEPISAVQMSTEDTFTTVPVADGGWDFDNVWGMYLNNDNSGVQGYGFPYISTIDNFILITPDGGSMPYTGKPAQDPSWSADNPCDHSLFTGSLLYDPAPAVDMDTYNITIGPLYDLSLNSLFYQISFMTGIQFEITAALPSSGVSYTITASSDANSAITPPGQVTVQSGGSMTFTYSANNGYQISSVLVNGTALSQDQITGSYTFTNVLYNQTIEVKSASGPGSSGSGTSITLTEIIVGGNGTAEYRIGSGQYISFTGSQSIPLGSNLYVSVEPDSGYSFVQWTGDVNSSERELNFTNVSSDINLTAHLSNDNATGSAGKSGNFAVLNLILAILALFIGIAAIFEGVWRKKEDGKMSGTAVISGLLALIAGIVSIIVFFLTEDLSAPMITTDNWTVWMAVLFVVAVILAAIAFRAGGNKKAGKN